MPDAQITEELLALRERLRSENTRRGRVPQVCTDAAIEQMASNPPSREADLLAIEGFGESAVDRYGAEFLRITRRYASASAGGQGTDSETARALREMQKRLVNLSKGNRMLFMPRTGTGVSFDIGNAFGEEALGLVLGRKGSLSFRRTDAAFRRIGSIIREVNRDLREHGTYDLYIGYPFAEGMLQGEDGFPIRAPLALFPVTAEKSGDQVTISYDDTRDAVFNTTLVLAAMKAAGIRTETGDQVIEEGGLQEQADAFYSPTGFGFRIPEGVVPFTEYPSGSFPEHEPGTFEVVPSAVFGKFPSYSSMVERDVDLIINSGEVNGNLRDLLRGLYSGDFRSEFPLPLTAAELAARGIVPRESNLFRINDLDGAQEAALLASTVEEGLVVQGPPGTGKSQVVTAMIASAAASGKTVLMVSGKRTALDVVRSRLGPLSQYCMQVDDPADKEGFFARLRDVMDAPDVRDNGDLAHAKEEIDSKIAELSRITDMPFDPGNLGIGPSDLRTMVDGLGPDRYTEKFGAPSPTLMSLSDAEMQRMISKFSEGRLVRSLKSYDEAVSKHPWAEYLRTDLTEKDLAKMVQELGEIYQENQSVSKKGFLGKIFARGSLSRKQSDMAARYLVGYTRSDVEDLTSDIESAVEFLEEYEMFQARAADRRALTSQERAWWRGMATMSRKTGLQHPDTARALRETVLREHLRRYRENIPSAVAGRPTFTERMNAIGSLMDDVRDASRVHAQAVLSDHLGAMRSSRRYQDMVRIAGQKRKWSVPKFMGRYGYELSHGIRIWLMTPEAVSETLPLDIGAFDLLVFDEASQMFAERGIPAIYRSKRTVVAGDHKQLRPSALGRGRLSYDDDEDVIENGSLLDLARSRYISVLLNYHYRSESSPLIAFSDRAFYGGRLLVSPDAEPPEAAIEVIRTEGVWEERTNTIEAERAVSLLKEVLSSRKGSETVGVIAFNIHQMNLISDLLEAECARDKAFGRLISEEEARRENGEDVGLFVKNVESVQGDERDIIIFSVGYAKGSDGKFVRRFGWLNSDGGANRLNVAITRARKKIYILQSFDPEELGDADSSGPGLLRRYLEYARCITQGDTAGADGVLEGLSPSSAAAVDGNFIGLLAERLGAEGFRTSTQVSPPVVLTAVKEGSEPLAFVSDRSSWDTGGTARERNIHRRRFLAARGWKVIDVWSEDAAQDPEKEIRRILDAL